MELANVQRELGFGADAKLTLANTNLALETSGSPDRVPTAAQLERRSSKPPPKEGSEPPDSGVVTSIQSSPSGLLSRLEAAVKP